jgi:hypothetical protein
MHCTVCQSKTRQAIVRANIEIPGVLAATSIALCERCSASAIRSYAAIGATVLTTQLQMQPGR